MLKRTQTLIASSIAASLAPAARTGATSAGRTSVGCSVSFSRKPSVARSLASIGAVRQSSNTAATILSSFSDRDVGLRSEDTLIQARGERGEQLALADAPIRRSPHHRLRIRALRRAEEL